MAELNAPLFFRSRIVPEAERIDVLVVDDDAALAASLSARLRREGYRVGVARDGRAALEILARQPVALLLSDVFMPNCDGLELLRVLQQCAIRPRFIAMSGVNAFDIPNALGMANLLGAERVLAKPFETAELLALLRELIGPVANPSRPTASSDPAAG